MNPERILQRILENKKLVFFFIIIVNLPLLILTFNTGNWSDDYEHTVLLAAKAKFTPLGTMLFQQYGGHDQGGHFAPVYVLINYLFTFITMDPRFFHFLIMVIYIINAFLIYLIVEECVGDKLLGLLAGALFSLNYYNNFTGLLWNCMHVHVTNTFFGTLSILFLLRYLKRKKAGYLFFCALSFMFAIFDIENGFVFLPVLFMLALYSFKNKETSFKKFVSAISVILMAALLYPLGAYLKTGNAVPLSYRFSQPRSLQGYLFKANQLVINSSGLTIFYDKLIVDKLKSNMQIKEAVKQLIRENRAGALRNLPFGFKFLLGLLTIFTILGLIIAAIALFYRIRGLLRPFLIIYVSLLLIVLFIFYRTDVANAIAIFSSVIISGVILSFLRDRKKVYRAVGAGVVVLYFGACLWTIIDRFDDCYRQTFYGLSEIAMHGPDKIYRQINKTIGKFASGGIILFTDDYSSYRKDSGYYRIGNMIDEGDFLCFNAAVYYKDLLKTDFVKEYKDKPLKDLYMRLSANSRKVIVSSIDAARSYLKEHRLAASNVSAVYISKDYQVTLLK